MYQQRKKFLSDVKHYIWEDPFLYNICADLVVLWCVSHSKGWEISKYCHSRVIRGHFNANSTVKKVLETGFFWPSLFVDAEKFVNSCDQCQRSGNLFQCDEMKQIPIQQCEAFDVWGINFMEQLPNSNGNKYVLVAVDYISKWVKAQSFPTNEA